MLSFNTPPNDKSCAMALSDFRRIALSMPETEESNGMGYPNFRTGRKSFATIEDSMAVIKLTRDQQATFVATAPEVFAPDSSGWGRLGRTVIRLEGADETTVQIAIATAWNNVAEVINPPEVIDVTDVQIAAEFVNVEANGAAEVADVMIAADVNAIIVNAGEVADGVSAAAFVNVAEVVEASDAPEVVNATVVVNAAEVAEVSASEVSHGAEVVEIENAAVSVEPRDHLLSVIRRQAANAGNHGERSMTLTLVAIVKRENMIDLKFGEAFNDPQPFVLTVTPGYVAHETAKSLPLSASDLHAYILGHLAKLRATAKNCKAGGLTSELLQ